MADQTTGDPGEQAAQLRMIDSLPLRQFVGFLTASGSTLTIADAQRWIELSKTTS